MGNIIIITALKQGHKIIQTLRTVARVALKNWSAIFVKILTAVEVLVSVHGGHLSVGNVLKRGKK